MFSPVRKVPFVPALLLCCIVCSLSIEAQPLSTSPGAAPVQEGSDSSARSSADVACARTVERFVEELDRVLAQSPDTINGYRVVLAKHLFHRQGFPGMPPSEPGSAITGCDFQELLKSARRSRFFFESDGPPRRTSNFIEFRNQIVKVHLVVDVRTGDITNTDAWWIKPHL